MCKKWDTPDFIHSAVSIPFREFKCCRRSDQAEQRDNQSSVSIPFREFKCCRRGEIMSDKDKTSGFNPFQGIQVLSVQISNLRFIPTTVSIPFREFKCCRMYQCQIQIQFQICFNPFQGIQVLSVNWKSSWPNSMQKFQSLSGNSSVVGKPNWTTAISAFVHVSIPFREFKCCRWSERWGCGENHWVSIPFREFKCCRNPSGFASFDVPDKVSIPFREFKCCRELCLADLCFHPMQFQSLSGNSSVVGPTWNWQAEMKWAGFNPFQGIQVLSDGEDIRKTDTAGGVSIPFREFKCCRWVRKPRTVLCRTFFCFNPFQGIQVLSDSWNWV